MGPSRQGETLADVQDLTVHCHAQKHVHRIVGVE